MHLITDKDFRDQVVNLNGKENHVFEKWIKANPQFTNEINKAREFIERMTFPKEQLLPFEMDELLEKIFSCEKLFIQWNSN
jgi:hypothetical protein